MASKRVLVVGGGLGIGQYVTEYLVKRHHARVVVLSMDVSEEIRQLADENKIELLQGDATDHLTQKRTLERVSAFLGGLDSLVFTIGVIGEIETIARLDLGKFRRTFAINVFAPVEMTQLFLPLLGKSKGRVVILSSIADREATFAGWSSYCSSKAALTRIIELLGHEQDEVQVFGVYPGLTRTPMVTDLVAGKFVGRMKDKEVEEFKRRDKEGEVEPPEWSANTTAKIATHIIGNRGKTRVQWYHEFDPEYKDYKSLGVPVIKSTL